MTDWFEVELRHDGALNELPPSPEEQRRIDEQAAAAISDAEALLTFDGRHTCAHHGVLDCETCRDRELEARGT